MNQILDRWINFEPSYIILFLFGMMGVFFPGVTVIIFLNLKLFISLDILKLLIISLIISTPAFTLYLTAFMDIEYKYRSFDKSSLSEKQSYKRIIFGAFFTSTFSWFIILAFTQFFFIKGRPLNVYVDISIFYILHISIAVLIDIFFKTEMQKKFIQQ